MKGDKMTTKSTMTHKPSGTYYDMAKRRDISDATPIRVETQMESHAASFFTLVIFSNGLRVPASRLRYLGMHLIADWAEDCQAFGFRPYSTYAARAAERKSARRAARSACEPLDSMSAAEIDQL
jgi:hypothetical protein